MPGSPAERQGEPVVSVTMADYLWFVDLALGEMARIVGELGDDLANRRPPFRDANSPYAILTHCLGVMEFWGGASIAERAVQRDRPSEFTAQGEVAGLLRRTEHARLRLREDLVEMDEFAPTANVRPHAEDPTPYTATKGAVLLHIVEELFQHLGQMELTRDAIQAATRR